MAPSLGARLCTMPPRPGGHASRSRLPAALSDSHSIIQSISYNIADGLHGLAYKQCGHLVRMTCHPSSGAFYGWNQSPSSNLCGLDILILAWELLNLPCHVWQASGSIIVSSCGRYTSSSVDVGHLMVQSRNRRGWKYQGSKLLAAGCQVSSTRHCFSSLMILTLILVCLSGFCKCGQAVSAPSRKVNRCFQ